MSLERALKGFLAIALVFMAGWAVVGVYLVAQGRYPGDAHAPAMHRVHDDSAGVTCFIARSSGAISCLPDADLGAR